MIIIFDRSVTVCQCVPCVSVRVCVSVRERERLRQRERVYRRSQMVSHMFNQEFNFSAVMR